MKLGIMGGTFDPVHNAHLLIAQSAMEEFGLDRIIFVTAGNPPHKSERGITDACLRHEMVKRAAAGNPRFLADDYEVKKADYSYTSDMLTHFKTRYPAAKLYFIIGADSLAYMHNWYRPDLIVKQSVILTYPRSGDVGELVKEESELLGGDIRRIHAPRFEVSSTMIRQRLKEGKSVKYLVPDSVIDFIDKYNLYKD